MANDISEWLRQFIAERAANRCEYCRLHADDSYWSHPVDPIISRKHGGTSTSDNLAYACFRCNVWKGSDISSLDPHSRRVVPLFHPRRQCWEDHFRLRGFVIEPLTAEARATVKLLKLNLDKRVAEQQLLAAIGHYPVYQ